MERPSVSMLCATELDGAAKHRGCVVLARSERGSFAMQHATVAFKTEPPLVFHYTLSAVLLPLRNSAPAATRIQFRLHVFNFVSIAKSVNYIALSGAQT
jgi:hypothetical protein